MDSKNAETASPVKSTERYIILDALRGFALLGIALANFPEFALYTFKSHTQMALMPTFFVDNVVRYLQYIFIDGKFYTLFSLLFGIGFSIIINHAMQKNTNGFHIFYRRMWILLLIGFLHLMFIWSGDILMLYAALGLLLPLFKSLSDKHLLVWAESLLVFPILVDVIVSSFHIWLSYPASIAQWHFCGKYGITDDNFGTWLRDANNYGDVLKFLVQGAFERMTEFIDGNRIFKVLGLFLVGFFVGRNRMYASLEKYVELLKKVCHYGFGCGVPMSFLYAYDAMEGFPFGEVGHTVLYTISVFPMGFAYAAAICLFYLRHKNSSIFKIFAAPGRMALTNYIGQSLFGMLIFYGIGFGLGANIGLVYVELIALGVYAFQICFSHFWLKYFRFGPLEWIWRMLTYGKRLSLRRE